MPCKNQTLKWHFRLKFQGDTAELKNWKSEYSCFGERYLLRNKFCSKTPMSQFFPRSSHRWLLLSPKTPIMIWKFSLRKIEPTVFATMIKQNEFFMVPFIWNVETGHKYNLMHKLNKRIQCVLCIEEYDFSSRVRFCWYLCCYAECVRKLRFSCSKFTKYFRYCHWFYSSSHQLAEKT